MGTIKIDNDSSLITPEQCKYLEGILTDHHYSENKYGQTFSGRFKESIRVKVNERRITTELSLPKYINGQNQNIVTLKEQKEAIERLGNELRIPLWEGKVKRLDIPCCIILKEPVDRFFTICGQLARFNRLEQNSGLYYAQKHRYVALYDKGKEVKSLAKLIEAFWRKHILRYEYRWLNHATLAKDLNLTVVTVRDLFDNYHILIEKWLSTFLQIVKNHDLITFNSEAFKTSGDFEKQILIKGVEMVGGLSVVLKAIKEAKDRGDFGYPNQPINLRKKFTELMTHPVLTQKTQIGKEIEDKVRAVAFVMSAEIFEQQFFNGMGGSVII